jgi:hypothetical protein
LRALHDAAPRAVAFRELGLGSGDPVEVERTRIARIVSDYAVLTASYPRGAPLLRALARLHEMENLKLLLRAVARNLPAARYLQLWRPLGTLELLHRAKAEEVCSVRDLLALAAGSPYEELIGSLFGGGGESRDASATPELALDRFGSQRLRDEAKHIEHVEPEAARLVLDLVRCRDVEMIRRAAAYGIAPELAPSLAVVVQDEPRAERLVDLAAWKPELGPIHAVLPPRLRPASARPATYEDLVYALRRRRRRACAAAFIGGPFRLAPAVAHLLLLEEETRGLVALAEAHTVPGADRVLDVALAGSGLGD